MKGEMPDTQYTEYTSETAKAVGKIVNELAPYNEMGSPMILDNYIRSWGGALGQYAIQVVDEGLKKAKIVPDNVDPTRTLSDLPFIRSFVTRFPQAGANSVTDFYNTFEKTQKVVNSVDALVKKGDVEGAERLMMKYETEYMTGKMAEGLKKSLSASSGFIRKIHQDSENYTADEKRQLIDQTYLQMIEAARMANEQIEEMRKQNKAGE
jgi:hypothetical protein